MKKEIISRYILRYWDWELGKEKNMKFDLIFFTVATEFFFIAIAIGCVEKSFIFLQILLM